MTNATPAPAKRGPGRPRKNSDATPTPTPTPTPTAKTEEPQAVTIEEPAPAHPAAAVDHLLQSLRIDPRTVKRVEISPQGTIRVFGIDNSAHSTKITPFSRFERDVNGRIIE